MSVVVGWGNRLLALGADGIMTNDPAVMKTLFQPS